jgi:tRNA (pseudouridine54-N1)-methyltransferase
MPSRSFILIQNETRTDADFTPEGVANNGRLDIGCRFLNAALFTSYSLRRDVDAHLLFNGPPDPPVHLHFHGEKIAGLHPDERSIAGYIKKNMASFQNRKVAANQGVSIDKRGLGELLDDAEKTPVVLSEEEGKDIKEVQMPENPIFVLGDNRGIAEEEMNVLEEQGAKKISVSDESYQAQQVAAFLNVWMDRLQ